MPGRHASFARDHEYKRHGTLSLLAGIDLLTGKVHALVRERHRSREFIEFLKLRDAAYPASKAIKLILDNHSAHISRETRAWLDTRPPGRIDFTFTSKQGSWLKLIEGLLGKFTCAVCVHRRVTQGRTQSAYGRHPRSQSLIFRHPLQANARRPSLSASARLFFVCNFCFVRRWNLFFDQRPLRVAEIFGNHHLSQRLRVLYPFRNVLTG